jgi:hypothetical protein
LTVKRGFHFGCGTLLIVVGVLLLLLKSELHVQRAEKFLKKRGM